MKRKRNWAKIIKRTLIFSLLLGLSWFFGANWAIQSNAEGKLFDQVAACPKVKVALVLGTSRTNRHGNDNLYFSYRIKAAVELYRAGKVKYLLVSGDNSITTYDEPTDMKNALIAAGIPANCIFLDYAGFPNTRLDGTCLKGIRSERGYCCFTTFS